MKVRFTAPTEDFPFFHDVRVQTKAGWQRVKMQGPLGWAPALFPTREQMIEGIKGLAR